MEPSKVLALPVVLIGAMGYVLPGSASATTICEGAPIGAPPACPNATRYSGEVNGELAADSPQGTGSPQSATLETSAGNVECERSTIAAKLETVFNKGTGEWEVLGTGIALTLKECKSTITSCSVVEVEEKGTFNWKVVWSKVQPHKVIVGKPELLYQLNCSGIILNCRYAGTLANKRQFFGGYYNPPATSAPTSANPGEVGVLDFSTAVEELTGTLGCPTNGTLEATYLMTRPVGERFYVAVT
jgi:hypothetical protein